MRSIYIVRPCKPSVFCTKCSKKKKKKVSSVHDDRGKVMLICVIFGDNNHSGGICHTSVCSLGNVFISEQIVFKMFIFF